MRPASDVHSLDNFLGRQWLGIRFAFFVKQLHEFCSQRLRRFLLKACIESKL